MKITDLEILRLEVPLDDSITTADHPHPVDHYNMHLAKVYTDEGLVGIGGQHEYGGDEDFPEWAKYTERTMKTYLKDEIVEPAYVRQFSNHFHVQPFGTGVSPRPCLVEIALWDLLGKETGKPISHLLGAQQDKVKAYASVLEPYPLWGEEEWVDFVQHLYDQGFKAVKLHIGWEWEDPNKVVRVIEAIREVLGDKVELMIDAMQSWRANPVYNLPTAIKYAKALEPYNVLWLEEPLPHFNNPDLSKRLCQSVDMEIAGGGAMFGSHTFKSILESGALDIVQPDVQFSGGIAETQRIISLAESNGRRCIPHCWGSGLTLAATLQLTGSYDIPFVEFPYHPPAWTVEARDKFLTTPIEIDEDGYVKVPEKPGLGVELDSDTIRDYTI